MAPKRGDERSWGHVLRPLDDWQRQRDDEAIAGKHTGEAPVDADGKITSWRYDDRLDGPPRPEYAWCSKRCDNRREFILEYRYVTGRQGRVSSARKAICRQHAEATAAKYGIPMPELSHVG